MEDWDLGAYFKVAEVECAVDSDADHAVPNDFPKSVRP